MTINGTQLTGNNGPNTWDTKLATGIASGPIQVRVKTDFSVTSFGVHTLSARCETPVPMRYSTRWGNPLPNNLSGLPQDLNTWMHFDPCPGGGPYTVKADYNLQSGDSMSVTYVDANTFNLTSTPLTGIGSFTARAMNGPFTVSAMTDGSGQSVGMTNLTAACDLEVQCHGPQCFTTPAKLPNSRSSQWVTWDACGNGTPFTWATKFSFEYGYDFATIGSTTYTGSSAGTLIGYTTGPVPVRVTTDYSVQSDGIYWLNASCAW